MLVILLISIFYVKMSALSYHFYWKVPPQSSYQAGKLSGIFWYTRQYYKIHGIFFKDARENTRGNMRSLWEAVWPP